MKFAVIVFPGSNCDVDMFHAIKDELGEEVDYVWHDTENLDEYDAILLPGGFSYGDYLRCGAISRFANAMKAVQKAAEQGKPILGVCNGFQILVELGLLPAVDDAMSPVPTAALYTNDSARFECRPTVLRNDNRGKCIFTSAMKKKQLMMFPSAHAEGKLMSMDENFVQKLEDNDQVVFRYVTPDDEKPSYPWNPNGSPSDIAGICNPAGNVMGLMPHPERVLTRFTHPDWTRGYDSEEGDGILVFRSVMEHLLR